jgi:mannose-6-phosphate isomerase-like protein (cupin superfamily)
MVSTSACFPKHQDYYDVWYWQVVGEIDWKIWDNDQEYHYKLKPNDLIFVPKGMWHQTFSCKPRAGISFGINKNQKINS